MNYLQIFNLQYKNVHLVKYIIFNKNTLFFTKMKVINDLYMLPIKIN
jgi:hypothetical protein